MKKLAATVFLLLGLALAEQVPVTAFHLVPEVLWPAPTYRLLGADCEALLKQAPLPKDRTLKDPQCYRMAIANPEDAATYLYFVARGLSQRFKLKEEKLAGKEALVQLWQGKEGTLFVYVRFAGRAFDLVAGWLAAKPKPSGS
jgi:hypothetical protein